MKYKTENWTLSCIDGLDGTTLCMGGKQFPSEGNRENALTFCPVQGLHWRSCAIWRSVLGAKPFRGWTRSVRRLEGDDAWDLQFLNVCVGSPWNATARRTQQGPTIQQKGELASGKRAKRLYLRQNMLDKYGRAGGCPGCAGIGQHTEERRARIGQEMVDKGDAI